MIKSKLEVVRKVGFSFPKIMTTDNGMVVLFQSSCCGVVLSSSQKDWRVGEYSDSWIPNHFKDYFGDIILSNLSND